MHLRGSVLVVLIFMLGMMMPRAGWSQWLTQEFSLRPGWNAIFLEARPEPDSCDIQFATIPVEGVWFFNSRVPSM